MIRTERLVIRLNKSEAAAVDRLAEAERLPASTLARRLLLLEAERPRLIQSEAKRCGLWPPSGTVKAPASEGVRP